VSRNENSRKRYDFSRNQRIERGEGLDWRCEHCGGEAFLEGHHIISAFLARRNPVLTPQVIKQMENLMMLCDDCHEEADMDQRTWREDDIGIVAWALFDLDAEKVAKAQWTQRPNSGGGGKKKKKKKKNRNRKTQKRRGGGKKR
jgi:hypothetical protein